MPLQPVVDTSRLQLVLQSVLRFEQLQGGCNMQLDLLC